ncbi:hypothetical protein [Azonexus hydrophilus]|uniref:hypothetical protein n=1 Tax=Azonexus hydrophilus TaxID=418702 RepID=UPI0019649E14|nr:hypothetical protein [Azonexus hydrophilus]
MEKHKIHLTIALGGGVFALLVAALLQLIVIPLTPWHGGNGLLAGGDWVYFHELAVQMADQIHLEGWQAWSARPKGQAPAGVASFLYALTGIRQPWVVLPVNAILYGVALAALYSILHDISGRIRESLLALLPMFLMPSLVMVFGQIHKDIWVLAGLFSILAVWVRMLTREVPFTAIGCVILLLGNLAIGYVRPYALELLLLGQSVMLLCAVTIWIRLRKPNLLLAAGLAITISMSVNFGLGTGTGAGAATGPDPVVCVQWNYTLPLRMFDQKLENIARARKHLISGYPEAGSSIDTERVFRQAADVIGYFPRMLQVALLAPFPSHWFDQGKAPGSKVMRAVAALEMSVLYFSFVGLGAAAFIDRRRIAPMEQPRQLAVVMLLLFTLSWVAIYVLATVNIGSLYRVRMPAMLLWISFGVLAWQLVLRRVRLDRGL